MHIHNVFQIVSFSYINKMAKNQFKPHKLTMNHLDEDQIYSNILRNKGNSKDGCLCSRLIQSNLAISDYIISSMLRMKIKYFGL